MIPFHRPSIGEAEIEAAVAVLRSGWLTSGPKVIEFEQAFADAIGVEHAVAVNSATAALHLALEALGVGPGDEVILPTYTFTACGEVVAHLGAKIVLADVGEDYLMGPRQVLSVATKRTKAVIAVHFAGLAANVPAISGLGYAVIEDAAHALPAMLGDEKVGSLGNAAAFSFYATKTMTTGGEGGMLTTDDALIADRVRMMRLHGLSAGAWDRYGAGNKWAYSVEEAGYKDNLTDLAAAIGIVQLRRLGEMAAARRRIAARYDEGLKGVVDLPPRRPGHSWHLYIIGTDRRDTVMGNLTMAGIGASVHVIPLHLHPYYQRLGYAKGDFPNAERLSRRSISLPIWPDMSDAQVDEVIAAVRG